MQMDTLAQEIEQTLLKNMFKQGNDTYKVLPTQADRDAFILIMEAQRRARRIRSPAPTGSSRSNFGTRRGRYSNV